MFGAVAPILDMDVDSKIGNCSKVQPKCLFFLLLALEKDCVDILKVMDMVEGEKPLKPLVQYHMISFPNYTIHTLSLFVSSRFWSLSRLGPIATVYNSQNRKLYKVICL